MRKFRKALISAFAALCVAQSAVAVPAYPHPLKMRQADGTVITVLLRGDEKGHLAMTQDGYPLYYNSDSGNYEYATMRAGMIAGSGIVAADAAQRNAAAKAFLMTQDKESIVKTVEARRESAVKKAQGIQRIKTTDYPSLGEQNPLVILVEFSDMPFKSMDAPKTFYQDMFNKEGFTYSNGANGSVRDFYLASSFGKYQPTFDVLGPVKLSKSYAYYGKNDYTGNDTYAVGEMIKEAVLALDAETDFSKYDYNGDGYIDNIYFFYAGKGEADGGNANTIWPHAYTLESWGLSCTTDDGVKVGSYSCSNEVNGQSYGNGTPTGIGTFVHEFGHVLGLADHYATNYSPAQYVDPGTWDTMASGSYNNNSNTPPLFSAFERAELGWLDYTELSVTTDTLNKLPNLGESNMAYKVTKNGDPDEYFILENRQQEGWDTYLPGHGMLVWHVDMDRQAWMSNTVNNDASHQRLDIVEADKRTGSGTYAGDPFPGTSRVTSFDFNTWDGKKLFGVESVTEGSENISFLLAGTGVKLDSPAPVEFTEVKDSSFVVSWSSVSNAAYYQVNISTVDAGGTKTALDGYTDKMVYDVTSLTVDRLLPETQYEVSVVAGVGPSRSEAATATVTTLKLAFKKRIPEGITMSDVTENSFKASWDAMPEADDYVVTLNRQSLSESTVKNVYDFTGKLTSLPELWEISNPTFTSIVGNYGKSSPALRMDKDGDYVRMAYADMQIAALKFWCKASGAGGVTMHVEAYNNGEWSEVDTFEPQTTAETKEYSFTPCDSVRLRLVRTSNNVSVDDIELTCHSVNYAAVDGFAEKSVGNVQSYTFTGLDDGGVYSFEMYGKSGDEKSIASNRTIVRLVKNTTGIHSAEADNAPEEIYDLLGRKMPSGTLPSGIYIVKKGGKTVKVAR